jgi:uncharacterized membrane protein YbhN (UPF0104 family)
LGTNQGLKKLKSVLLGLFKLLPLAALGYIIYGFFTIDVDFSLLYSDPLMTAFLAVVVILYTFSVFLTAGNFSYVLSHISGVAVPLREIVQVYITANLYKYLPGNVLHYVGRNSLASAYDIPQKDIAFTSLFEVIINSALVALLSLMLGWSYAAAAASALWNQSSLLFSLLGAVAIAAAVGGVSFLLLHSRARAFARRMFSTAMTRMWAFTMGVFSFNFFINGFSYFLILSVATGGWDWTSLMAVLAAYNIAWLAGFVTPGAPGGIGVKEFVLVFLLGTLYPEGILLLSVVLHRLGLILSDVLAFAFKKLAGTSQRSGGQSLSS